MSSLSQASPSRMRSFARSIEWKNPLSSFLDPGARGVSPAAAPQPPLPARARFFALRSFAERAGDREVGDETRVVGVTETTVKK